MYKNETFLERVRFPISDAELDRRYAAVSAAMREKDIDMLVMSNDNQYLGGYTRYFLDIAAEQAYPTSALFSSDGELISINSGGSSNPLPPPWAQRRIKERWAAPYFRTLGYTDTYDAELIVRHMKHKNVRRIGMVGKGMLNWAMIDYIREHGGAEVVDATRMIDDIRAVKSEEEIARCIDAVVMHDEAMAYLLSILKPGMYEYELRAEITNFLINYGSEEQLIMQGSAPGGVKTPHLHSFWQNRRIQENDDLVFMIEANGPGGYYCEIVRTISLGEPSKALIDTFGLARKFQHAIAGLLVPGAKAADILNAYQNMLAEHDFPPEERLFAHGQGYDLVEFPGFLPGDDGIIKENMFIAVHPNVSRENAMGFCCDNYLVTKDGAKLIQKTPQEILTVRR